MHEHSLINVLGAGFFIIAGYVFLYPLVKSSMGRLGAVGAWFEGQSKRMDLGKGFRKRDLPSRGQRFMQGSLFSPNNKLAKPINAVGAHVGATRGHGGWRMGFGQIGQAKRANAAFTDSQTYAKEDIDFAKQINNEDAMAALAFGNDESKLRQLQHFQIRDAQGNVIGYNQERINNALATGRTIRVTNQSRMAAADSLARSKKIIRNRSEASMLFASVSGGRLTGRSDQNGNMEIVGGNTAMRAAAEGSLRYVWRQVGRNDIGRASDYEALEEMGMGEISSLHPFAAQNLIPAIPKVIESGVDQHGNRLAPNSPEMQHYVDLLYSAQFNPYTKAYQQGAIDQAINRVKSSHSELWTKAAENYSSKLSARGTDPSNPQLGVIPGVGGPHGPPPPTMPPDDRGYL